MSASGLTAPESCADPAGSGRDLLPGEFFFVASPFWVAGQDKSQLGIEVESNTGFGYFFFLVIPDSIRDQGSSKNPGFRLESTPRLRRGRNDDI
jgi:hypothetical protein